MTHDSGSNYYSDEEVDSYRDKVFLLADEVNEGTRQLCDVPEVYLVDVIDTVFHEATGRKMTIETYMKFCTLQAFLRNRKVQEGEKTCTRKVSGSIVE